MSNKDKRNDEIYNFGMDYVKLLLKTQLRQPVGTEVHRL